ncbi:MAG TPA: ATPase [Acidimicrobiaceae bacterium]|nr:ATPase [Acidimicrobiaceae bacterium]
METSRNTSPRDTATLEDPTATWPGDGTLTQSGSPGGNAVNWYQLDIPDTMDRLSSSIDGLGEEEAKARLAIHGPNELKETGGSGPLKLLWEQLTAVMVLILIGAAALSLALGKFLEAGAIGTIVVLFALLGFVQEYRAEKAIAALRRMAVPTVRVIRDGQAVEIESVDLVPGDLVSLEAGNVVPADLRLLESASLRIQEAALTGESEPVDKESIAFAGRELSIGDRVNMAYSGTQVTYGRGRGMVVETGMNTELGKIATLLQGVSSDQTPLQERLDKVGKQLALAGVVVAGIVVGMGALGGESFSTLALTAISVAVAVIPEGLPAVVTFTLAIGAQRMLRRNALIRKLPAVETLGSVTVICSDKTGTLTQNKMTVTVVDVAGGAERLDDEGPTPLSRAASLTLAAGVLCNDSDAQIDDNGELITLGDPTETALLSAAHNAGISVVDLRSSTPRSAERPFDSERKRMSTVHAGLGTEILQVLDDLPSNEPIAFVKGAVDGLLSDTVAVWDNNHAVPMNEDWRQRVLAANDAMAEGGMRVLGVAFRTVPTDVSVEVAEQQLTLLGLIGIIDPPRVEVRDAVTTCTTAGIRTVMITGDHPLTAQAIATDLGITKNGSVITGAQLDQLDEAGLTATVASTSVFARVSPEHKLRIVGALQGRGEIVAMTGDGVNDAPALKRADIGVAMGITGTDVSKEASDIVLRDDNFATIVAAVEEGRVIYDNLRRFVKFAVAGNIGKIIVMLAWPVPFLLAGGGVATAVALLPLQLLWLNLMTDGLLGLSLGVEPAEKGVMGRDPHRPGASIWAGGLGIQAAWIGALIGAASLAIGFIYEATNKSQWQTMIFTSLAFLQIFQAIGTRSTTASLRTIGLWSNPVMTGTVVGVSVLQLLALYTPLNGFLDLEPLGLFDLGVCVGSGLVLLAILEGEKAWRRRGATGNSRPATSRA